MQQSSIKHFVISAILAVAAVSSIALAHGVAHAKDIESRGTAVETIEIDIEQEVASENRGTQVVASETTSDSPTQFLYLVGLASIGLIGIAGIVRDVRHDKAA